MGRLCTGKLTNMAPLAVSRKVRSEGLHHGTKGVIRKAARLTQRSWGETPKAVGHVAFQEVKTGLFLTVQVGRSVPRGLCAVALEGDVHDDAPCCWSSQGDEVKLLEPVLCNLCKFAAFRCQTSISGFQSVVTKRWLGQTFLGSIKVSAVTKRTDISVKSRITSSLMPFFR
jgi:hypothetical protein